MPIEEDPARRDLLILRLYYLFWIGGGGFLAPFYTLFLVQRGLSGAQVGLLGTIGAASSLVIAPLWARLAARANNPQRLMQYGLAAGAVCLLLLGRQSLFGSIALITLIQTLVSAGLDPLSSNLAFRVSNAGQAGFGTVRLFGSLGWVLSTLLSGVLVERFGLYAAFAGNGLALFLAALLLGWISHERGRSPSGHEGEEPAGFMRLTLDLLRNPVMVLFALANVLSWFLTLGVGQFEPVFLANLGASAELIGLANTIGAVVEMPAMIWADRFIRRRGSAMGLQLGWLVIALSKLVVIVWPTVPAILISHLVGGISTSLNAVGYVDFIGEHARESQRPLVFAIFSVSLHNLVNLVASPASGALFDLWGPYKLYILAVVGCLATMGVFALSMRAERRAGMAAASGGRPLPPPQARDGSECI